MIDQSIPDVIKTKKCSRCGKEKPVTEFYKQARTKDGFSYLCKVCNFLPSKRKLKLRVDLTGQRFGALVVIEHSGTHDKYGHSLWICQCDCGNIATLPGNALTKKNSDRRRSCGCRYEQRQKLGLGPVGSNYVAGGLEKIISEYKTNAKRRGYEWRLTKDDARHLFTAECFYCGEPPSRTMYETKDDCLFNGIDRIDSSMGYFAGNCVPCCTHCNYAKRKMTLEEFCGFISRVYHRLVKAGRIVEPLQELAEVSRFQPSIELS